MTSTVWRGNIAFGLVSIPVRLIRAARRERIRFRQVYQTPAAESALASNPEADPGVASSDTEAENKVGEAIAPVHRIHTAVSASGGEDSEFLQPAQILKGYEIGPDRYVTLRSEEVKAVKPKTSTSVEITSFVRLTEIDPIYFDASYYILPQPAGEKPYAILFGSLQHANFTALGQMAMHGREHAVVIRTGARGLILETLFYQNEVHLEDQYAADPQLGAPAELKMAEAFIKALHAPFDPAELVDRYEKRIKALIDSRTAAAVASATVAAAAPVAPGVDIMEELRKSLEQARKPAAREIQTKARAKRSRAS